MRLVPEDNGYAPWKQAQDTWAALINRARVELEFPDEVEQSDPESSSSESESFAGFGGPGHDNDDDEGGGLPAGNPPPGTPPAAVRGQFFALRSRPFSPGRGGLGRASPSGRGGLVVSPRRGGLGSSPLRGRGGGASLTSTTSSVAASRQLLHGRNPFANLPSSAKKVKKTRKAKKAKKAKKTQEVEEEEEEEEDEDM